MKIKIEKGDNFKCIKTFKMESGEVAYKKGKEYFSESDRCITDEQCDVNHVMHNETETDFFEYFILIYTKKK